MLRSISVRKLIQKFHTLGFVGPYAGGRHLFMERGSVRVRVPNPHGQDISKDLLAEILRQAGVTKEEWGTE